MLRQCQTAIILAGGKSSRMGFDKVNIPYKEGRLLDYQINVLKQLFTEIIIVSNSLTIDDEQVKVVTDEYKEIGPLAGLHVGLKHATSLYAYVIACDMPFINIDFIRDMDAQLESFNQDVLVSKVNGKLEPFNSIYHKSVHENIEDYVLLKSNYGLKTFIKSLKYRTMNQQIVDSYNKKMFYNLNTTDDIKEYLE